MVDIRSCEICKSLLTVEEQEKNTLRYANKEHYLCNNCRDLIELIVNMAVNECERRLRK